MCQFIGVCCVYLFVCMISNQCWQKLCHLSQTCSKLDTLLCKTHSKVLLVLRYQALTSVSLSYHQLK